MVNKMCRRFGKALISFGWNAVKFSEGFEKSTTLIAGITGRSACDWLSEPPNSAAPSGRHIPLLTAFEFISPRGRFKDVAPPGLALRSCIPNSNETVCGHAKSGWEFAMQGEPYGRWFGQSSLRRWAFLFKNRAGINLWVSSLKLATARIVS